MHDIDRVHTQRSMDIVRGRSGVQSSPYMNVHVSPLPAVAGDVVRHLLTPIGFTTLVATVQETPPGESYPVVTLSRSSGKLLVPLSILTWMGRTNLTILMMMSTPILSMWRRTPIKP